jgi:glycosyltransferase involved in cell wall biosynthesis
VKSQADSLAALGIENTIYEIEGWKSAGNYARAMFELPALAQRTHADLVHAHYGLSGTAAMLVPKPLVVSFCGDDLLGRPDASGRITGTRKMLTPLSRLAAMRADAVIVKSEEMRRKLGRRDVEVIPNGVDLARFAPMPRDEARTTLGWAREGQVILFAGDKSEPRKNYGLALEVERRLRERGRDVRLVPFHGKPQKELVAAMNAADVLILPSYHEGSPNVVKEAMAVNLPVVASPVGDCVERLLGVSPGAVAHLDPQSFTDAVDAVLQSGRRSNGRDKVKPLELSAVAQRVLAVYNRVLHKRSA